LTLRELFVTSTGRVRAGWRALIFCIIAAALYQLSFTLIFAAGRPASSALFELEAYLVLLLAFWVAHAIMLRWVDHTSWSYVGLGRENFTPRALAVGFALGALCILVPSGTLLVAHDLSVTTGLHGSHSWGGLAVAGAAIFLPQSLGEEMLSRGYLFSALRDAIGWLGALAVTSLGFGLLHWHNPGATLQSVSVVVFAGVFLGAILIATRSLYAAWMAHFAWNWSMAEVLHAAVSGAQFPYSSYRVESSGPVWLTGGSWGPEGGAAAVAGMLAGLAVLFAWQRNATRRSSAA